jgi:hypothetical protein
MVLMWAVFLLVQMTCMVLVWTVHPPCSIFRHILVRGHWQNFELRPDGRLLSVDCLLCAVCNQSINHSTNHYVAPLPSNPEELSKCRSSDQSFACGHFLNLEQSSPETRVDVPRSLVYLLSSVLSHNIPPKTKHCPSPLQSSPEVVM